MSTPSGEPVISTVFLSWQRPGLLDRAVRSYAQNTSVAHEAFLVDNGSQPETIQAIARLAREAMLDDVIMLDANRGGEAFNAILPRLRGRYLHFAENDGEYLPGWDVDLLAKLDTFGEIGQISPFAPIPQTGDGEVWVHHEARAVSREGRRVCVTSSNVGTTCVVRRAVIDQGVQWSSIESPPFRWPNDAAFSAAVRRLGWQVSWNDHHVVRNWGHNVHEWNGDPSYYLANYRSKTGVGIAGLKARLDVCGYDLVASPVNGVHFLKRAQ